MARPKEFEPEAALEQAMHVFWEKGYEATSMHDLVERTGVHRGSLYATFGNKERIYAAALQHYGRCEGGAIATALLESDRPVATLKQILRGKLKAYAAGQGFDGCMLANAAAELRPEDPEAFETAAGLLEWRERFLHEAMKRAKKAGELGPDANPRKLARYLNAFLTGVSVMLRTRPDVKVVEETVEQGFAVLTR